MGLTKDVSFNIIANIFRDEKCLYICLLFFFYCTVCKVWNSLVKYCVISTFTPKMLSLLHCSYKHCKPHQYTRSDRVCGKVITWWGSLAAILSCCLWGSGFPSRLWASLKSHDTYGLPASKIHNVRHLHIPGNHPLIFLSRCWAVISDSGLVLLFRLCTGEQWELTSPSATMNYFCCLPSLTPPRDSPGQEEELSHFGKDCTLSLKAVGSSCASLPSHPSWSLGEHMAWESRKCSVSAGWIRDGVTGCEGVVMGTLAGACRNLPSKAEHRCWARQGGSLLVKGPLQKSPRKKHHCEERPSNRRAQPEWRSFK